MQEHSSVRPYLNCTVPCNTISKEHIVTGAATWNVVFPFCTSYSNLLQLQKDNNFLLVKSKLYSQINSKMIAPIYLFDLSTSYVGL